MFQATGTGGTEAAEGCRTRKQEAESKGPANEKPLEALGASTGFILCLGVKPRDGIWAISLFGSLTLPSGSLGFAPPP